MAVRTVPAPTGGDDQTLLQNFINSSAAGDELVFPAGNPVYRHSDKIIFRDKPDMYVHAADGGEFTLLATNVNACSVHIWSNSHRFHIKGLRAKTLGATARLNNAFQNAGIVIDYADYVWTEDCVSEGAPGLGWYLFNANYGKHDRPRNYKSGADGIHLTYGSHHNVITDSYQDDVGDDFTPEIGYANDGQVGRPNNNTWIRPVGRNGHARGVAFAGAYDSKCIDPDFTDTRAASIMFACERGDFNTMPTERCSVTGGKVRRSQIPKDALGKANDNSPVHAGPILYANAISGGVVDCTVDGVSVGDFTGNTSAVAQMSGVLASGTSGVVNLKMYAGTPTQLWQGTPVGSTSTWSNMRTQTMAATATSPATAGGTTPTPTTPTTPAVAPALPTVFDSCTRTSTTTPGITDTGHTWTPRKGTWGTTGTRLYSVTGADDDQVTLELGSTEQQAAARPYGIGANRYPEILLRWSATGTHYWVEATPTGAVAILRRVNDGFTTLVTSATGVITDGALLAARVVEVSGGTQVTVYVNGAQVATFLDTAGTRPMGTSIGLRHGVTSGGQSIQWDDIQATTLMDAVITQKAAAWVTSGTSITATLPVTPRSGALLLLFVAIDKAPGALTIPSPWTHSRPTNAPSLALVVLLRTSTGAATDRTVTLPWTTAQGAQALLVEAAPEWSGSLYGNETGSGSDDGAFAFLTTTAAAAPAAGHALSVLAVDTGATAFTATGDPQWPATDTRVHSNPGSITGTNANGGPSLDVTRRAITAGNPYDVTASWATADQTHMRTYLLTAPAAAATPTGLRYRRSGAWVAPKVRKNGTWVSGPKVRKNGAWS